LLFGLVLFNEISIITGKIELMRFFMVLVVLLLAFKNRSYRLINSKIKCSRSFFEISFKIAIVLLGVSLLIEPFGFPVVSKYSLFILAIIGAQSYLMAKKLDKH